MFLQDTADSAQLGAIEFPVRPEYSYLVHLVVANGRGKVIIDLVVEQNQVRLQLPHASNPIYKITPTDHIPGHVLPF